MDVLDHSCSKMGFGGKMCIDGTFKYDEEKDDNFLNEKPLFSAENADELLKIFPEIKVINFSLASKRNSLPDYFC